MARQSASTKRQASWQQAFAAYADKRAGIMALLGFSAGIPILLIFSSLSLWLREAGVDRSTVTMFSWAALGYSFKFIWAPLIDTLPLPVLTRKLGRRRGWLLVAQLLIIGAILWMASVNPADGTQLFAMAVGAVWLGFSSATQDIVIDAYRIELADTQMQSVLSATYNAGYRIGMIVAGAGALFLAEYFGSVKDAYVYEAWRNTYWIMAAIMGVGMVTTLMIREPDVNRAPPERPVSDYARLVLVFVCAVSAFVACFAGFGKVLPEVEGGVLVGFLLEAVTLVISLAVALAVGTALVQAGVVQKQVAVTTWVEPIWDFFRRYGKSALVLLLLIGLYRISDIVAGVISNVFYEDMGFSKSEIATAVKLYGVLMVIIGGFVGGIIAQRFRIMQAMMIGGVLACMTNLMFVWLASVGYNPMVMYLAVITDNLASGLAGAVFIAFLSSLTSIRFTAVQYAIFSSLMTLIPKVLGGYSGTIVDNMGYAWFFTFTTLLGLPILALIYWVDKTVMAKPHENKEET